MGAAVALGQIAALSGTLSPGLCGGIGRLLILTLIAAVFALDSSNRSSAGLSPAVLAQVALVGAVLAMSGERAAGIPSRVDAGILALVIASVTGQQRAAALTAGIAGGSLQAGSALASLINHVGAGSLNLGVLGVGAVNPLGVRTSTVAVDDLVFFVLTGGGSGILLLVLLRLCCASRTKCCTLYLGQTIRARAGAFATSASVTSTTRTRIANFRKSHGQKRHHHAQRQQDR